MSYRNTLQADALKLVAKKLQSSLAVEGELPTATGTGPTATTRRPRSRSSRSSPGGRAGRLRRRRGRRGRPDDGVGPQDRQRGRGGGRGGDGGGGLRTGQGRRGQLRGVPGGRRLEGRRGGAGGHRCQRQRPSRSGIGPTVELVLGNGRHANGNGNGHAAIPANGNGNGTNGHHEEAPEPQQSLFSWAEFMAEEAVKPKGRGGKTQAPSLSLFEWAVEQEREESRWLGAGRRGTLKSNKQGEVIATSAMTSPCKSMYELDAPIDVKECCGIGLSSVGRRRPRERHSV